MREKFKDNQKILSLKFSKGGQISIDIVPPGWDKTQCLDHLGSENLTVHFFGDKTGPVRASASQC